MFGPFIKKESLINEAYHQAVKMVTAFGATPLLITQGGKIVMIADSLKAKPQDWYGGQVVEVMIARPGMSPYFVYYENNLYYIKMAQGMQPISAAQDAAKYRNDVSQALCLFLMSYLKKTSGVDISHPQLSFSHNRVHTNVLAYVKRLNNWYPIQHGSSEPDSATERKVAQINSGKLDVNAVIAIDEPSPA